MNRQHENLKAQRQGRLAGKVCLVAGAAQGIGRSAVDAFLREQAQVIAIDLQDGKLAEIEPHPLLQTARLDATDSAAVTALAKRFPEVEVLVNCVGYVADGTILTCTAVELQRSFLLNVVSMSNTITAFLPAMLERGRGSIINVASVVSSVKAAANRFAYGTTKAAVIGLTKSVACDFVTRGIRCNAISPGTIDTPSLHERIAATADAATAKRAFIERQPMGRLGRPEEIGELMVLLAADEAAFMTGANIVIDGGMSL